jgi:hypothetical protein
VLKVDADGFSYYPSNGLKSRNNLFFAWMDEDEDVGYRRSKFEEKSEEEAAAK